MESNQNELIHNLEKLHTTELGVARMKRNLSFHVDDVVEWCSEKIQKPNATIARHGKNWYITVDGFEITVNASCYTIITVHKLKRS